MSAFSDVKNYFDSMFTIVDGQLANWRKQAVQGTVDPAHFIADAMNLWSIVVEGWLNTTPGLLVTPTPTLFIKLDTTLQSATGSVNTTIIPPSADPTLPPPAGTPQPPGFPTIIKFSTTDLLPITGGAGKITSNNVVPAWVDFGTLQVTINGVKPAGLTKGALYQGMVYLDTGVQPQVVAIVLGLAT
jgi:hypothetical protein